jgi:hypothetical protein
MLAIKIWRKLISNTKVPKRKFNFLDRKSQEWKKENHKSLRMIRLSLRRYSFILLVQLFFLVSDLVFNSVGVFLKEKKSITFLYFSQDAFLILSLASLVYSCYSTYIYQAGLTGIINRQFMIPVLITLIYIVLSISLHVCTIYHDVHLDGVWPKAITTLFVVQKLCEFLIVHFCCNLEHLFDIFQGVQFTSTSSSAQF